MTWLYRILWLAGIGTFFASAYFLGWIGNVREIIVGINTLFWAKLPWEFQVLFVGFLVVIILWFIRMITRD